LDERIQQLLSGNDQLQDKADQILDKVDRISNDRVVSTGYKKNNHMLMIIKNNDNHVLYRGEIRYEYHALRVMRKGLQSRLTDHLRRHPNMEVLTQITFSPNSINLWIRIKKQLGSGRKRKISVAGSKFNLVGDYTEDEMIEDIKTFHHERFDTEDA
jgi:hypothetical protein